MNPILHTSKYLMSENIANSKFRCFAFAKNRKIKFSEMSAFGEPPNCFFQAIHFHFFHNLFNIEQNYYIFLVFVKSLFPRNLLISVTREN